MASTRPPNLVVFLPDQQRADTISCYGGRISHAPNLARLSSESVIFDQAYVTHPVCTPARSSIMTGTWPHQNGCTRNGAVLPAELKCLPQMVPGYVGAYFGKWHLGNDAAAQRGFEYWISTEGVSDYSRFLAEHGYAADRADQTYSRSITSQLPIDLCKPRFLERHACRFIEQHRDEPFILFVAFVEPHSPYNGPLNEEHSIEEIELDETALTAPRADLPLRYRLMREWQEDEAIRDRQRLPQQYYFGITPEEYRGMKQRYLGLVTLVDRSIGAILAMIEKAGLARHTIVVHTSDHGDMLGAQHLFGKEVMYEQAVRVPLLVRMPDQRSSQRIAQPVSHIDLLPTLIDLLGGSVSEQCAGVSRAPLCRGQTMRPASVFLEWSPNRTKVRKGTRLAGRWAVRRAVNESTRTVITPAGLKLSLRAGDLSELYHLPDDPTESHNLYADSRYRDVISEAAEEIRQWQGQTGDRLKLRSR